MVIFGSDLFYREDAKERRKRKDCGGFFLAPQFLFNPRRFGLRGG
jgi:hypothetical protein